MVSMCMEWCEGVEICGCGRGGLDGGRVLWFSIWEEWGWYGYVLLGFGWWVDMFLCEVGGRSCDWWERVVGGVLYEWVWELYWSGKVVVVDDLVDKEGL